MHFIRAGEEYNILPRSRDKNQLHNALEDNCFEVASGLIASSSETYLLECFEGEDRSCTSCLHIIAAMSDAEQARTLCSELMKRVKNTVNRTCLLNARTIDEYQFCGRTVRAHVAPIHIAAYKNNLGVMRVLYHDYGVDINSCTSEMAGEIMNKGIRPLHLAASNGCTAVVQFLVDNKADPASYIYDYCTPLFAAVCNGHTGVVEMLVTNEGDINARRRISRSRNNRYTPLFIASRNADTEIAQLLIDNKADVNEVSTVNQDDITPLFIAAENGDAEVVKLLLDNGADTNVRTSEDNFTPLSIASIRGHTEVVQLLIQNKVDVNAVGIKDGFTPLMYASLCNKVDVVKLLLDNEADVIFNKTVGGYDNFEY